MTAANSVEVLWYLTPPDGRYPWVREGRWQRDTDLRHFQRVASTIDTLGFSGALVATTGPNDVFTFATALMPVTTRMKFLVALYPGLVSPRQLAHMALTFDALSGGRLVINAINGTDDLFPPHGIHLGAEERYQLSSEYWTAFKRIYAGERGPLKGVFYDLAETESFDDAYWEWLAPVQDPHVPLWGAGGSAAGLRHAGEVLDVYLTFLDTPNGLCEKLGRAEAAAVKAGRRFDDLGLWASVIIRETEDEAWAFAQQILDKTGADRIAASVDAQLRTQLGVPGGLHDARSENPTVQRLIETLRRGDVPDARDLEFYPNVWSGPTEWSPPALLEIFDPARSRGTYLVGSAEQVADRIKEFRALGIGKLILGGWPLIDEAEYVAELLLPLLELA